MTNKPEMVIVHHTAVSYDKNPDQFKATKAYHISKGWGDIGYHYEIAKNGTVYKGRAENLPGAHTKEQNINYKSIGICLDGDFDKELPTAEQTTSLKTLLLDIIKRYNISKDRIFPHRHYAVNPDGKPYKSCYGSSLSDDWASKLIGESPKIDTEFTKKWEGKFILNVEDKGKLYYVSGGKRHYVSPDGFYDFAKKFSTGFKNSDVLRIPEG